MSESELFKELLVLFVFGHFSERGGCLIPNCLRNFSVKFGHFSGRGRGGTVKQSNRPYRYWASLGMF